MSRLSFEATLRDLTQRPELWLTTLFVVVAVLSGAVIASQNMMLMALVAGALISTALMSAPAMAVWLILVGTLIVTGPLVFNFPSLNRLPWMFSVLGIFLTAVALLHAGLRPMLNRGPVPGFMLAAIIFMVYALASTFWGASATLSEKAAGARRFFHFWGLLFAIGLINFPDRTIKRWALFILWLAICQFPAALYQRIVIHPTLLYNQTLDAIVGTFEVPFTGGSGSSGVLAFMQIVLMAALTAGYREGLVSTWGLVSGLIALLIPLAVGETNVMFIWIPLALGAVFIDHIRQRPGLCLFWATGLGLFMAGFATIYLIAQQSQDGPIMTPAQKLEEVYEYNLGDMGYGAANNLNRTTVLSYWFEHHGLAEPVTTIFGHGMGSSFSSGEQRTILSLRHANLSIDLLAITSVLWDLGLVGAALYMTVFVLAWRTAYRLANIAQPGWDRALARSLLATTTLLLTLIVYNNNLITTATQQVLTMFALGILCWMARRYHHAPTQQKI